jgi:uncharacterized protein YlxW (UPF0749 family)
MAKKWSECTAEEKRKWNVKSDIRNTKEYIVDLEREIKRIEKTAQKFRTEIRRQTKKLQSKIELYKTL